MLLALILLPFLMADPDPDPMPPSHQIAFVAYFADEVSGTEAAAYLASRYPELTAESDPSIRFLREHPGIAHSRTFIVRAPFPDDAYLQESQRGLEAFAAEFVTVTSDGPHLSDADWKIIYDTRNHYAAEAIENGCRVRSGTVCYPGP